jgi:hypothetical protein
MGLDGVLLHRLKSHLEQGVSGDIWVAACSVTVTLPLKPLLVLLFPLLAAVIGNALPAWNGAGRMGLRMGLRRGLRLSLRLTAYTMGWGAKRGHGSSKGVGKEAHVKNEACF